MRAKGRDAAGNKDPVNSRKGRRVVPGVASAM